MGGYYADHERVLRLGDVVLVKDANAPQQMGVVVAVAETRDGTHKYGVKAFYDQKVMADLDYLTYRGHCRSELIRMRFTFNGLKNAETKPAQRTFDRVHVRMRFCPDIQRWRTDVLCLSPPIHKACYWTFSMLRAHGLETLSDDDAFYKDLARIGLFDGMNFSDQIADAAAGAIIDGDYVSRKS